MKKYKILSIILSSVIAAGSFCGCSKESDKKKTVALDPDNPVTVTVWNYYNGVQQTAFDEMVQEFNNTVGSEKGIIVEASSKSSIGELAESVIAAAEKEVNAEDPPSIFATYSETAYKLDKMGMLADLKQYIEPEKMDEYIKAYIDEGIFTDGSLKIFPTAKSSEIMMVNKTDWDKFASSAGVDQSELATIEGVVQVAEKYYDYTDALTPDVPNDGKAFFGRDSVANYMYIGAKQLGSDYFEIDKDGNAKITITKDALKKLWENYYIPYVKGYFTAENRYRSDDAKTGSIISLICSTTGAMYFPSEVTLSDDSTYKIENIILPVPHFADKEDHLVQQGAGMSVMKSDEKTEYASTLFLEWFTEEQRNIQFSVSSGYLPVKKTANNFDKVTAENANLEKPMSETMLNVMSTAINGVNNKKLYTPPPFGRSAEARDYIEAAMQDTAVAAHAEAMEKISAGGDRDTILSEYTSEAAFEKWYENFISGLESVIS